MGEITSLSQVIGLDQHFSSSINLALNLNDPSVISKYIPTASSVAILNEYLDSIIGNTSQSSVLIGPYGKGKSHLMLVLTGLLSLPRTEDNSSVIANVIQKVSTLDSDGIDTSHKMEALWESEKRYLPVLISAGYTDIGQSFMVSLHEALKREGIQDIIPNTAFSEAIRKIELWKNEYPQSYQKFEEELENRKVNLTDLITGLKTYSYSDLDLFLEIYPHVTAGAEFNLFSVSNPLQLYDDLSKKLQATGKYSGIFIIFDEFSKFIEGINNTSIGQDMKILQDFCEFANGSNESFRIFLTIITHKSIKEYGRYLSQNIINGFTGIEGRLVERNFLTTPKNNYELLKWAIQKDEELLHSIPDIAKYLSSEVEEDNYAIPYYKSNFSFEDFGSYILTGCYPLSPLASYLLLNISERVGQNERTMFTFISRDEPGSLARYIKQHTENDPWIAGPGLIYDYFSNLFRREPMDSRIHTEWLNAEFALTKAETDAEREIIKTLALVLMINKEEEIPATESFISLGIEENEFSSALNDLKKKKVILNRSVNNSLIFGNRANSALRAEIDKRKALQTTKTPLPHVFEEVMQQPFMFPKRYNADFEITRFFKHEFMEVNSFLGISNPTVLLPKTSGTDGIVISLFSEDQINMDDVCQHLSSLQENRIILVIAGDSVDFRDLATEFDILEYLEKNSSFSHDEVMSKEIPLLKEDIQTELKNKLMKIFTGPNAKVARISLSSVVNGDVSELNNFINDCFYEVYDQTPVILNEQINRSRLTSSPAKRAQKRIIEAILNHSDGPEFYRSSSQEATIYRSIFEVTGLINQIEDEKMRKVIQIITEFLEDSSTMRNGVGELIDKLVSPPYGLRKSLIPILLAWVIASRNEEIIITDGLVLEVPLSAETLVSFVEEDKSYGIQLSRVDLETENYYKRLIGMYQSYPKEIADSERMNYITGLIQNWYKGLPLVTRNMVCLESVLDISSIEDDEQVTKSHLLNLRKTLNGTQLNPYQFLFQLLPSILTGENDSSQHINYTGTISALGAIKKFMDDYLNFFSELVTQDIKKELKLPDSIDLYHGLTEWLERSVNTSLKSNDFTSLSKCIRELNVYDDIEIAKKVAKAVSTIYIEDWNKNTFLDFNDKMKRIYNLSSVKKDADIPKRKISITNQEGKLKTSFFENATDDSAGILQNILEDTMEDFADLSLNDRVAVLVNVLERLVD